MPSKASTSEWSISTSKTSEHNGKQKYSDASI